MFPAERSGSHSVNRDPTTTARILLAALFLAPPVLAQRTDTTRVPLVPRPPIVRGLYVNRWAAVGKKMWRLIDVAKRTEVNALVLDVKDDRGYLLYRSSVPLAHTIGADKFGPMPVTRIRALLDTMRAHGIYPIPSRRGAGATR